MEAAAAGVGRTGFRPPVAIRLPFPAWSPTSTTCRVKNAAVGHSKACMALVSQRRWMCTGACQLRGALGGWPGLLWAGAVDRLAQRCFSGKCSASHTLSLYLPWPQELRLTQMFPTSVRGNAGPLFVHLARGWLIPCTERQGGDAACIAACRRHPPRPATLHPPHLQSDSSACWAWPPLATRPSLTLMSSTPM